MADDNVLVEKLELKLGYEEFISGLRTMVNAYHGAVDQITNLGSGIGKSLLQSSKAVQDTILNLSKNTQKTVADNFLALSNTLGKSQDNVRKSLSQINSDMASLEKLAQKRGKLVKEQSDAQEAMELARTKAKAKGMEPDETFLLTQKAIVTKTVGMLGELDKQTILLQKRLYTNLSNVGVQTAESFRNSAYTAASGIMTISRSSNLQLKEIFKTTGNLKDDIENVVLGKETYDKVVKQRKTLADQLTSIDQDRIKAQQSLDATRIAFLKQVGGDEIQQYKSLVSERERIDAKIAANRKSYTELEEGYYKKVDEWEQKHNQLLAEKEKAYAGSASKQVAMQQSIQKQLQKIHDDELKYAEDVAKKKKSLDEEMGKLEVARNKANLGLSTVYSNLEKGRGSNLYKETFDNNKKAQEQLSAIMREQKTAIGEYNRLGESLVVSYSKFNPALQNIKQNATDIWNNISDSSKKTQAAYKQNLQMMMSEVAKFGQLGPEQANKFYTAFARSKQILVENIKEINQLIIQLSKLKGIDPGIGKVINDFSALRAGLKEQIRGMASIKTSVFGNMGEFVVPITTAFADFKKVFSEMTRDIAQFGTLSKTDISKYATQFQTFKEQIKENIVQFDGLIERLKQFKSLDPGVGKMISHFTNLRNELKGQAKSMDDAVKVSEKLNFSGPLAKSQQKLSEFKSKVDDLFTTIYTNKKEFKGGDFTSALGIQQGLQNWKSIVSASEQLRTQLKGIRTEIANAERYESAYEVAASRTSNEQKRQAYKSYAEAVKSYIAEMQARYEVYAKEFTMGRGLKEILVKNSEALKQTAEVQLTSWKDFGLTLDQMRNKYEDVRKYSSRWGETNRKVASDSKEQVESYGRSIINIKMKIQEMIKSLHQLSKEKSLGFDATALINDMSKVLRSINTSMPEIRGMMAGATKMVDAQVRKASKSWYTLAWESIRNFRWQVAGLIYLTQQAIQGIRTVMIDTFEEIDSYRRNVYAFTGIIGMVVDPATFKNNFSDIFSYSRDLMDKLQAEAGRTYASFEDLQMVTRSFAQTGIFPKTQEDIAKIGTLATAVKVMTEGMANEGVQMRQEIMALIEGRARVTDTLARMLQMHGIDIKKAMAEWERLGKDKLTGFSELFSSFAEINKHIAGEYGVQVQRLKTTWEWIKRIAGEGLTLKIAEDIKAFVDSLGDLSTGQLTNFGKEVATSIKTTLIVIYEIVKSIGVILVNAFQISTSIFQVFGSILSLTTENYTGLSNWGKAMLAFFQTLNLVERGFIIINSICGLVGALIRGMVEDLRALVRLLSGDLPGAYKAFKEGGKYLDEWNEKGNKAMMENKKRWDELLPTVKELERQIDKIGNATKNSVDDAIDLGAKWMSINKSLISMDAITDKYKTKNKQIEEDRKAVDTIWENSKNNITAVLVQLNEKAVQIDKEANARLVELASRVETEVSIATSKSSQQTAEAVDLCVNDAIKSWSNFLLFLKQSISSVSMTIPEAMSPVAESAQEAIQKEVNAQREQREKEAEVRKEIAQAEMREQQRVTTSQKNQIASSWKNFYDKYKEVDKKREEANRAITEKTAKGGGKTMVDLEEQYYSLLEKLGALDPFKKIWLDYKHNMAEIAKLAQENTIVQEHRSELEAAANKMYWDEVLLKEEEVRDFGIQMWKEMTAIESDPFAKIDSMFDRLMSKMEKSKLLIGEQGEAFKEWYRNMEPYLREKAKELEMEKQLLEIENKRLDLYSAMAKKLSMSASFGDKQMADSINAITEYKKWYSGEETRLNKLREEATTDQAIDIYNQQKNIFDRTEEITRSALDEQLREIWNPFYKDLKEMNNSWADSISSTFTDILFDATDWKTKITDLMEDMSKEIINAFVKRNLVEPMIDKFNSLTTMFGIGSSGGFFGKIGEFLGLSKAVPKEAKDLLGSISMKDPMPVYVTNFASTGLNSLDKSIDNLNKSKTEESKGIFESIQDKISSVFTTLKDVFSDLFNKLVNLFSGLKDILSPLLSGIGNLFQSGGFFGNIFSGISSFFGFAEGGVINEPIFGVGLNSGVGYSFGERESELVVPMSKTKGISSEVQTNTHINFYMNAIDAKSGTEFLMKNSSTLEALVSKAVRNNRSIRRDIGRSF